MESEQTADLHWPGKQLAVGLFGRHRRCTVTLFKSGVLRVTVDSDQHAEEKKGAMKKGWDVVSGVNSAAVGQGVEAECWVEEMTSEAEIKKRKSKPHLNAVHLSFPAGMRDIKSRSAKRQSVEDGKEVRVQLDNGFDAEEECLMAINSAFMRMAHNRVNAHKRITALLEMRHTRFNPEEADNVEQIRLLWHLIKGDASCPPPLSRDEAGEGAGEEEGWSALGFQQAYSPHADFRGTGLLSLHCLIHYARHHSGVVASLVDAGRERRLSYPFAAAGINIVNMLVQLLLDTGNDGGGVALTGPKAADVGQDGLRSPLFVILTRLEEEEEAQHAFETLVCHAFVLLEQLWVRHTATYMMFNRVLHGVRECFRLFIAQEWEAPSRSLLPLRDFDISRVTLPPPIGPPPPLSQPPATSPARERVEAVAEGARGGEGTS